MGAFMRMADWDQFTDQELYDLYQALSNTSREIVKANLPIVDEARKAWVTRNTRIALRLSEMTQFDREQAEWWGLSTDGALGSLRMEIDVPRIARLEAFVFGTHELPDMPKRGRSIPERLDAIERFIAKAQGDST